MDKHKKSLFIFRRDLRLEDNTGLISALNDSEIVIPAFVFDPRQYDKTKNPYFSDNAFGFLIESLKDLDSQLNIKNSRLYIFNGIVEEVIEKLIKDENIDAIYFNKDYTPFSKKRDTEIDKICKKHNVSCYSFADALLNEPNSVLKNDGSPYTVFTPFWKNASTIKVNDPKNNHYKNYYNKKIISEKSFLELNLKYEDNKNRIKGGRKNAVNILNNIIKLKNYESIRDYPYINGTSKLSAHLKFGTVSIREAYWAIANEMTLAHPLLRQLYWRDFFYHIAYHFPKVFGHSFNEKYEKVRWDNDEKLLQAWKNGVTGFPIVDAGMRELNTTGYMHNRVRMIVASFLTKDLHIDWRLGEKYFAQQLVDYDPCINNGNWQWAASTGCDAQPYFRIFNPWLQQKKFDPKCEYIKRWILELKNVDAKTIHELDKNEIPNYPKPIIDHYAESKEAISRYKSI